MISYVYIYILYQLYDIIYIYIIHVYIYIYIYTHRYAHLMSCGNSGFPILFGQDLAPGDEAADEAHMLPAGGGSGPWADLEILGDCCFLIAIRNIILGT